MDYLPDAVTERGCMCTGGLSKGKEFMLMSGKETWPERIVWRGYGAQAFLFLFFVLILEVEEDRIS